MIELHIELTHFSEEQALYMASLANIKQVGLLSTASINTQEEVRKKKDTLNKLALFYDIDVYLGYKIAYIPPALIESYADKARENGFDYVCVHGENIYENIPAGTNFSAISANVDILLNPGIVDEKLIDYAQEKNTFFEFNVNPHYSSGNALLAHFRQKYEISLIWGNTIEKEKDFIHSLRRNQHISLCPNSKEYDLLKKLNQDTFLCMQNISKRIS